MRNISRHIFLSNSERLRLDDAAYTHRENRETNMTIESIALWHKRARPAPTTKAFNVQLGCHLEEVVEMLETLDMKAGQHEYDQALFYLNNLAVAFKYGEATADIVDRRAFLDSIGDQVVTVVGVGYCAGMNVVDAVDEVNISNWSKFDHNGEPTFDDNGKIAKPSTYRPPFLDGMF